MSRESRLRARDYGARLYRIPGAMSCNSSNYHVRETDFLEMLILFFFIFAESNAVSASYRECQAVSRIIENLVLFKRFEF